MTARKIKDYLRNFAFGTAITLLICFLGFIFYFEAHRGQIHKRRNLYCEDLCAQIEYVYYITLQDSCVCYGNESPRFPYPSNLEL